MRIATIILLCWTVVCGLARGQDVKIRGAARTVQEPGASNEQSPSAAKTADSTPRDMLELLGVAYWLDRASDGADFPPGGDELLWRSLYAVRRFSLLDIDQWSQSAVTPQEIEEAPEEFRGQMVSWTGTAVGLSRHEPPAEAAERFDLPAYFRCELEIGENKHRVIVYALTAPKQWQPADPLNERAGVKGLFTVLAGGKGESSAPVLVARRIAWYPQTPLGDLGMDQGLFDEISSRPGLTVDDRECFYQLLAAAERVGTRQLFRAVPQEGRNASVEPLFNKPQTQSGRLVELTGTARQAVLRRVEDRDIVERFGIDHFYEMQVFTGDSQDNPLTFCVRELPKGFPTGERITEPVRIAGFFFKKWGYRSSASTQGEKPGVVLKQLAPLLIGREPIWIAPEPVDQRFANGVFLVLFVVMTVAIWLVVARLSRSDDKFHKQVAQRFSPPPNTLSDSAIAEIDGTSADEFMVYLPDDEPTNRLAIVEHDAHEAGELRQIATRSVTDHVRKRQQQYALATAGFLILIATLAGLRLLATIMWRAVH
jgi:hypothetical protein